ncbi:MAG: hypothetical protein IPM54_21085 [Polyangiaceae bacterium]|nr:hypothetical protein [Polyangiaceae bacterium]
MGYAVKRIPDPAHPTGDTIASLSRRSFFARQLVWGPNSWTTHWEFTHNHIGALLEKAEPGGVPTGFTSNNAWNLNPLDFHADGTLKEQDYVAAVGLKTSTDRSGVAISVYNNADHTGGKPFDPNELNQCEPGYDVPDLASAGTIQNDVLIDVQAAPWYGANCDWASDWDLPTLSPVSGPTCNTFDVGTTVKVGVNLGDDVARRCPTYITCQPGQNCCIGRFDAGVHGAVKLTVPCGAGTTALSICCTATPGKLK